MKIWRKLELIICIVLFLCCGIIAYLRFFKPQKTANIVTSSTLKEAINISDLSTAKFIYNGITEIYKGEKLVGHIKYDAEVKAGIDMKEVKFEIDKQNLIVKPILPEIKIQASIVEEQKLSFIPENITLDVSEALKLCQDDVEKEAKESSELFEVAEENLQNTIEALIYPGARI